MSAPEGRKKLVPNIFLVIRHIVLLEESDKLLLICMFPMVFFLLGNVFCYVCDVRFAHAENGVSGLPCKFWIPFFMYPSRGVRLCDAGNFSGGMSGTNSNQHVDVVDGAVNDQRCSVHFADDASEIGKQVGSKIEFDQRASTLRRED